MIWKSACKGKLHHFELVGECPSGVLERCVRCYKKVSFRIVDGAIDNKNYLSYHMRDVLPKEHRLYAREYGIR